MKILVFSDSHGNVTNMRRAVEVEGPNRLLHLGDVVRDASILAAEFPHIPLDYVSGNCDYPGEGPTQSIIEIEGVRILMMHGHAYHVKLGIGGAVEAARKAQVDVLVFGHTHQPLCTQYDSGLWVMNPGSVRDPWGASYGVIKIHEGKASCYLMESKPER